MEQTKKIVSFVLVFLMVFSSFAILPSEFWGLTDVSAIDMPTKESIAVENNKDEITVAKSNAEATYTEGDFTYTIINDNEVKLVSYNGTSSDVVIPDVTTGSEFSALANKKVTDIGDSTFAENATLTTLTLPNSLKTIGSKAFYNCTKLNKLDIGSNLTKIGANAFSNCTSLSCVNIKSGKNTVIDTKAFYKCSGITSLTIGDGVKTINGYAFSNCTMLKTLTIGKDCTSIATTAFADNTSLESVTISDQNTKYTSDNGVWLNKEKTEILLYPKARSGAYTMPNTVTAIKENQFRNCKNLTEITIGDGVENIGKYAFQGCSQLSKVTFGKNIKAIEDKAFYSITTLEAVDLSVCTNLKTIGSNAFYSNTNMSLLLLPDSLEIIGDNAFNNCQNIIDLVIKDKITSIGEYAFSNCKRLVTAKIEGGNNAVIKSYAFKDCRVLQDLTIGNGVTTIGECAFLLCVGLSKITIPDTVTSIGTRAFASAWYIKDIRIGRGITSISPEAFNTYTNSWYLDSLQIIGTELTNWSVDCTSMYSDPSHSRKYTIYCYEGSTTHKTLVNIGHRGYLKFFKDIYPANIKVNGTLINGFDARNREHLVYVDDVKNVDIKPIFNNRSYSYHVSAIKNVYSIDLFNADGIYSGTYTVTVKKKGVSPTDIKVNGNSINNFNANTNTYDIYTEDVNNINIVPVFEQDNVNYKITANNNVYTLDVFDEYNNIVHTYKITVKQKAPEVKYTVTGDVNLLLNNISTTKVGGSIALPAGTYKLKIAKGSTQFGYNKTVTDYCSGLTLSEKYSSNITLNATGGTYTFQFDKYTNKLIIKHDSYLPNEYLIGDLNTILKPVGDRPLSIGTQQLQAGTYKFKLSIGGKEYGYNKVVNDATSGSLSMNSKYTAQVTLNATGGMYTFVLNTETNKLIIRHTPTDNENTTDVHISGTFNLVLNDKSATGEVLNVATGTTYLEDGCYTFKVYNYGVAYTAGAILNDSGIRTLSSKYTTPITLNATGGTYKFVFDKETGLFEVSLLA